MKQVRTIVSVFSLSIILFSLSGCAGGKDSLYSFEQDPPFILGDVYFQKWIAGVQEGGSGTNVYIEIESYTEEAVIKEVYFRGEKQPLKNTPQSPDEYTGYFKKAPKRDIIMDGNPAKESQNTIPEAFPFKLKPNEAIISYFHKGEMKYLKITSMDEKPLIAYPSTNPNGID